MHKLPVLIITMFLVRGGVQAGMITIGSDAPPGSPLLVNPGTTSGPMLVNVTNDTSPDDTADFMAGWQATLRIVPDAGAAGTLSFNGAATPANYVFAAINTLGMSVTNSGNELLAFDFNFPFSGGIQVPTAWASPRAGSRWDAHQTRGYASALAGSRRLLGRFPPTPRLRPNRLNWRTRQDAGWF